MTLLLLCVGAVWGFGVGLAGAWGFVWGFGVGLGCGFGAGAVFWFEVATAEAAAAMAAGELGDGQEH